MSLTQDLPSTGWLHFSFSTWPSNLQYTISKIYNEHITQHTYEIFVVYYMSFTTNFSLVL